jgi:glyoxylase-like metal-dependent hydrolase (beta-lactamase superfamily II)
MTMTDRRNFLVAGAGLAIAGDHLARPTTAEARAPKAQRQVAGVYRRQLGDFEITALVDGYLDIAHDLWQGIARPDLEAATAAAFMPKDGPIRVGVTSYLVNTGDRLILIDSGSTTFFGPTAGRFAASLEAAGVKPADVDVIAVTHMHPDHVAGLMNGQAAAFPNATLHICGTDHAFWASDANAARAPDAAKPWYKLARDITEAYKGRLQLFSGGPQITPGLTAMPLIGHTPGHTGYVASSGGKSLLFWGDAAGIAPIQFQFPDAGLIFDVDGNQGKATRRRMFDMAATDRLLVAGAHLPFPSFGYVARQGAAYSWTPETYQF